jgi:hypothetical protein
MVTTRLGFSEDLTYIVRAFFKDNKGIVCPSKSQARKRANCEDTYDHLYSSKAKETQKRRRRQ